MLSPISPLSVPVANTEPAPKNVEEAARQFESLLIAQMLQSARRAAREGFGEGEDDTQSSTVLDIAEQQFAQVLARNGGLGLARLVMQGLNGPSKPQSAPEP